MQNNITQKKFLIDYQNELNPQQFEAVKTNGALLVIAGAGSGKTRTIIYKVAYLIENGVPPNSILLLTFTKKAAAEMQNRAAKILDERATQIQSGTFHSYAAGVLRKYATRVGYKNNFTIADPQDAADIINIIRNEMNLSSKDNRFPRKDSIYTIISKAFNTNSSIKDVVLEEWPQFEEHITDIERIKKIYTEYKKKRNVMDYDDLLFNLRELLLFDDIRAKIAGGSQYVMVDEYQDTNSIQAQIACYLASVHGNITVVGDDSQSIYSFRGANFKNIMQFPDIFPDSHIVKLEENYRSIQPILDFTNAIIDNAQEKYAKKLFSNIVGQTKPHFVKLKNKDQQADFIVQQILRLHDAGIQLDDIAVLFRSSSHSNELELKLNAASIPYIKYGGLKFMETAHVKDVLAFLKIVCNPTDDMSFYRILGNIDGIGNKTATKIIDNVLNYGIDGLVSPTFASKQYYDELKSVHHIFKKIDVNKTPISEMINIILNYYNIVLKRKYDNFNKRKADLDSLVTMSENYKNLEDFITNLLLDPPNSSQVGTYQHDNEEECLVLSTIHSAKGLEFNTVFVINLIDGLFPSSHSVDSFDQIEEERRLFYVASTRAKQQLYLCVPNLDGFSQHSMMFGSGFDFSKPSRFLTEITEIAHLTEFTPVVLPEKNDDTSENAQLDLESQNRFKMINKFFIR